MSLLSTIEYQNGFSDLEKKIADYLIEHKEDVIHMNLKELAEATYTSTATISRFCKKLGEKNFNDFRVHFAEITQSQTFSTINFNKPFLQDSPIFKIVRKMKFVIMLEKSINKPLKELIKFLI